jgi:hypothetical protein
MFTARARRKLSCRSTASVTLHKTTALEAGREHVGRRSDDAKDDSSGASGLTQVNVEISQGDVSVFVTRPLSLVILLLAAAVLLLPIVPRLQTHFRGEHDIGEE